MRYKGEDGQTRHGDVAIAGMLGWYASRQNAAEYDYTPVVPDRFDGFGGDDMPQRQWWRPPAGARIRSGF